MSVWLFISQVLATSDPCHGSGCICLSQGMLALELWEQKPNHPVWPTGGPGGLSDPNLQDGAAAATAAGGATGRARECHCPKPSGQTHQHPPGRHGSPLGLCVDSSQLCGPPHEDTQQDVQHFIPCGFHCLSLEALGRTLQLCGPTLLTPQMMLVQTAVLLTVWRVHAKRARQQHYPLWSFYKRVEWICLHLE